MDRARLRKIMKKMAQGYSEPEPAPKPVSEKPKEIPEGTFKPEPKGGEIPEGTFKPTTEEAPEERKEIPEGMFKPLHEPIKKHMKKAVGVHKKVKAKERREDAEQFVGNMHEHLKRAGVPKELSHKAHAMVHSKEEVKHEVGTAIKEAVEEKERGKISGEGLTKIVQEAVLEGEKEGISKDELKDLIREILKSELQKGESLKAYQMEKLAQMPEEVAKKAKKDFAIPLPSVKEAEQIRREYAGPSVITGTAELSQINITYPLIVQKGKVRVYANIRYDPATEGLLYRIVEPTVTPEEAKILQKIEKTLVEELEVDFASLKRDKAEKYLSLKIHEVIKYYEMRISPHTKELLDYYIFRDFIGLGKVEPMFQDPNIEDISCDGTGVPIYIYHRDPRFGSIKTNVKFKKAEDLDSFVMKLAQRCNRSISVAEPLLDGALPDGSRVQTTFGTGISTKGSNFTIRKFTRDPLTFVDLANYGTINAEMLAYLWLAIEHQKSVLIAGPTASGKTTLLNSLSLFIRPELKVVTIEDTPELRLPLENWIAQVARIGFGPETAGGKKLGEVDLFDLLKASLRQRPDEIIVGEVRGKEAYVLFQQIATGHAGMSTIHAESMEAVINRLSTPPINLPPSLLQHLDILLVITRQRIKGKYIRRVKEVVEVVGYDTKADRPKTNMAYTWAPANDEFTYTGKSSILKDVMETTGSTKDGIFLEVDRRMKVIEWMQENGIRDYKNVGKVVNEYYQDPETLLQQIGA